ncbi:MAG: hypothetical protein EBY39_13455 [Flavobacteriia bacterium]|nr:hypothetical protein [Flavobacteriia bacterium]
MKFVLKDGLIHIVENHGLANNSIEGSVEAPGLDGFSLSYSINGNKYKSVKNKELLIIPKQEAKKTKLDIKVKAIKGDKVIFFKSDTIPLTHAVILGGKLEDRYPKALKQVIKEMEELKIELKSRMLDLVGTFEEITKKGSIF